MFGIGGPELLVIFLIVLLLFGAKRLPEIARSMGKATTEFKKAKDDFQSMANELDEEPTSTTASAVPDEEPETDTDDVKTRS